MNIPGFAAEASLYKPNQQYTAVRTFGRRANGVRTQLLIPYKPPGPQHVPGVDIACNQDCLNTCYATCPPNEFGGPGSCSDNCNKICCYTEYFPPPYPHWY